MGKKISANISFSHFMPLAMVRNKKKKRKKENPPSNLPKKKTLENVKFISSC